MNTLTGIVAALARSAALIVALSWLALTNVVVLASPFQRTTDDLTKPLPFTLSVRPVLPETALAGERLLATGTGAAADAARTVIAPHA